MESSSAVVVEEAQMLGWCTVIGANGAASHPSLTPVYISPIFDKLPGPRSTPVPFLTSSQPHGGDGEPSCGDSVPYRTL